VAQALLRGLHIDREARHPSMQALLAALRKDPWARRRRLLPIGAASAAVAVAAGLAIERGARDPCAGAVRRLEGAWDAPRKAQLRAALGPAGDAFSRIERLLDAYADRWRTAARAACEEGAHAGAAHAGRGLCLD